MKALFRVVSLSVTLLACGPAARAEGVLKVCLNGDAPPYSSRARSDGGFDFAVAQAVARQLGRKLEVRWFESKLDGDSSAALEVNALLSDGKCQLVAGYPLNEDALTKPGMPTARLPDFDGFKPSDRRRRITLGALRPTKAYHRAPLTIVVGGPAADKAITGLGDLAGVKIGVEGGTLSDTILMTYGGGKLIDDVTHMIPGRAQLWPALEKGEVDATLTPLHRFDAYRAEHPDTRLKGSGYLFPVGFNLGFVGLDGDPGLIAEVDGALGALLASGDIAALAPRAGMTYVPPRSPEVGKSILMSDLKTD